MNTDKVADTIGFLMRLANYVDKKEEKKAVTQFFPVLTLVMDIVPLQDI